MRQSPAVPTDVYRIAPSVGCGVRIVHTAHDGRAGRVRRFEGERMKSVEFPRIIARRATLISRWVTLVEKTVVLSSDGTPHTYHCLTQSDYVGVLAMTDEGEIPIVRQFRPAVERFTWELPAGTVDAGESPEDAAHRELLEETGLHARELVSLGSYLPDTGRLEVDSHAFFARATRRNDSSIEPGLTLRWVDRASLRNMIRTGEFRHQIHLAIIAAAIAHGIDVL